jgi:hypothetical protein
MILNLRERHENRYSAAAALFPRAQAFRRPFVIRSGAVRKQRGHYLCRSAVRVYAQRSALGRSPGSGQ